MAQPRKIVVGDKHEGVAIQFIKSRKVVFVYGWYDTYIGIEGNDIPLEDFCRRLGIQRKDLPE